MSWLQSASPRPSILQSHVLAITCLSTWRQRKLATPVVCTELQVQRTQACSCSAHPRIIRWSSPRFSLAPWRLFLPFGHRPLMHSLWFASVHVPFSCLEFRAISCACLLAADPRGCRGPQEVQSEAVATLRGHTSAVQCGDLSRDAKQVRAAHYARARVPLPCPCPTRPAPADAPCSASPALCVHAMALARRSLQFQGSQAWSSHAVCRPARGPGMATSSSGPWTRERRLLG